MYWGVPNSPFGMRLHAPLLNARKLVSIPPYQPYLLSSPWILRGSKGEGAKEKRLDQWYQQEECWQASYAEKKEGEAQCSNQKRSKLSTCQYGYLIGNFGNVNPDKFMLGDEFL